MPTGGALCLALAAAAMPLLRGAAARPRHLDDFSTQDVAEWLLELNLHEQFGRPFLEKGFDGDLLANYLQPEDLNDAASFPNSAAPHVRKLFASIRSSSRSSGGGDGGGSEAAVGADGASSARKGRSARSGRRRLAESDNDVFSGLEIRRNNSAIFFGENVDTGLYRAGEGVLASESDLLIQGVDVKRAASELGYTSPAWAFTYPGVKNYFMTAKDFTLPKHFTIELWVYPLAAQGDIISFASDDNFQCLRLRGTSLSKNTWHHLVVSYDRHAVYVHDNGAIADKLLVQDTYQFCGDYTGSLVIGQEQDAVGGAFQEAESALIYLDTVAIYDRAFEEWERNSKDKTCVDMADPSLVSVWSGYSRGKDLLGQNTATVAFEGFVDGVNGNQSCTVAGLGEGTPGSEHDAFETTHVTPAVGGVGWVFPGGDTKYFFEVPDITLPQDWSVEAWIYPLDAKAGRMFFSWATSGNSNCIFLLDNAAWDTRTWHHFVVTWDGSVQQVFLDGVATSTFSSQTYSFCGEYTGTLVLGQDQDSEGGGYQASQAPAMILDTVVIYNTALTPDEIVAQTSPCVNLNNPKLFALYSGFSRGKDLVGSNDGYVSAIEIVTPGMETTVGSLLWDDGEVVFDVDTCVEAQEEVGAAAPGFDDAVVGGVGWDFFGDSEGYYFATPSDFTFPDEFTIEFWAFPRVKRGHLLSFASVSGDANCLLLLNTVFPSYNVWWHIVATVDSDGVLTTYANGTELTLGWDSGRDFCGNTTGHLVFGQEQDSLLGTFQAEQAFDGIIDTVAVYAGVWTANDIAEDKAVGVDLTDTSLFALWSGYTQGVDLVGDNDAELFVNQFADGMGNPDANPHTVDMLAPATVGGVAWNFPTGQTDYYLWTGNDFTLPSTDWTIEFWIKVYDSTVSGYFISFASSSTDNCMIGQLAAFSTADENVWRHIVFSYNKDTDYLGTYIDGEEDLTLKWTTDGNEGFCGDTTGSLVFGQEQDSMGGGFSGGQAADCAIDTIAIYSEYWSATTVAAKEQDCINLHDPTLYTLWSGFTRGKDLVGHNHAYLSTDEFLEGAELDCSLSSR